MDRRIFLLLSGALLASASIPVWGLWQQRRLFLAYQETAAALAPFQPTQRHLQAIRKLQFTWNLLIESGGPLVDPDAPYGDIDIRRVLGNIIGSSDGAAVGSFHAEVSHALSWALRHGTLPVGTYAIPPLTSENMREIIRHQLKGRPEERIKQVLDEIPSLLEDNKFHFTADHRTLINSISFDPMASTEAELFMFFGWKPVPTVDFKRPFGDSTSFENDMAYLLGRPAPESDEERETLERLYWDMWPALQAFVLYAQIPTSD